MQVEEGTAMSTVQDLYRNSVRPLPPSDRLRLAALILDDLSVVEAASGAQTGERVHLLDFVKTLPPGPRCFATWGDFEQALQMERDSWDR